MIAAWYRGTVYMGFSPSVMPRRLASSSSARAQSGRGELGGVLLKSFVDFFACHSVLLFLKRSVVLDDLDLPLHTLLPGEAGKVLVQG